MNKTVTPDIEIAALEAARRFYAKLHPIEKPGAVRSYPAIYWFFLLITIASAALAALRTGPVFYDSANQTVSAWVAFIEALLAVVVVDLAAAGLAYLMVKERAKQGKAHNLGRVIFLTLIFCVVIQIAANLYAVVGPVLLTTGEHATAELIISVLVGLAAPIVAFISADGLSVINLQHHDQLKQEKANYERKVQDLFDAFETWYDARQRREWIARVQVGGVEITPVQITKPSVPALPSITSVSNIHSNTPSIEGSIEGNGKQKYTQNATDRVFQLFESIPESLSWSVDEISKAANVATGTASTARKKYREQRG